jgi:hypothetical protein
MHNAFSLFVHTAGQLSITAFSYPPGCSPKAVRLSPLLLQPERSQNSPILLAVALKQSDCLHCSYSQRADSWTDLQLGSYLLSVRYLLPQSQPASMYFLAGVGNVHSCFHGW